jgi:hypothetical protein
MAKHDGKFDKIQVNELLSREQALIIAKSLLRYVEAFPISNDFDLTHKKYVDDAIAILDPAAVFFGQFANEAALLAEPTVGIRDGSYAYAYDGATLFEYIWDLALEAWQKVEGAQGIPGVVDLPALDLRYLRKDVDDATDATVDTTFQTIKMLGGAVDGSPEYIIGIKLDGSLVKTNIAAATGDKNYEFSAAAPLTVWTMPHNLGKKPCYCAVDSAGNQIFGTPSWPDNNTMILTFIAPVAGFATLN